MVSRAFPVVYASDVEREAQFWEMLGFRRHFQLPADGDPGYVGLRSDDSAADPTHRIGAAVGPGLADLARRHVPAQPSQRQRAALGACDRFRQRLSLQTPRPPG
jgi:hypothetical protein